MRKRSVSQRSPPPPPEPHNHATCHSTYTPYGGSGGSSSVGVGMARRVLSAEEVERIRRNRCVRALAA